MLKLFFALKIRNNLIICNPIHRTGLSINHKFEIGAAQVRTTTEEPTQEGYVES